MTALLTADDVALMLRLSKQRIYALTRARILPTVRIGRQVRYAPDAIEDFVRNGGKPCADM